MVERTRNTLKKWNTLKDLFVAHFRVFCYFRVFRVLRSLTPSSF